MSILAHIGHGFRNIARFKGRDGGLQFWTYAIFIVALAAIPFMTAIMLVIRKTFAKIQQFAAEHPDQVTVTQGPGSYSMRIHGNHPELAPDFGAVIWLAAIIAVLMIVLLAAAIVRRLHDRDRSGWWAVMPLPFLAIGLYAMSRLFSTFANGQNQPAFAPIALLFVNNLIYLATIATLAIILLLPGTVGPNRYGPDWKPDEG